MIKKIKYNSPVIITFSLISLVSLVLGYITSGNSTYLLFSVYRFNLADPLGYIRMFTYVLGHANLQHYTGNMLLFLLIGPMLEEKYGSKNILIIILITAFTTALIQITLSSGAALGASGLVFAFIMLSSITSVTDKEIPLTMIIIFILYIGNEVINISTTDNISQLAHIIGGLVGMQMGLILRKK
jgi:membrane associated rhomboid family serine protease